MPSSPLPPPLQVSSDEGEQIGELHQRMLKYMVASGASLSDVALTAWLFSFLGNVTAVAP